MNIVKVVLDTSSLKNRQGKGLNLKFYILVGLTPLFLSKISFVRKRCAGFSLEHRRKILKLNRCFTEK